ncbi:hypothetical protein [Polaribacter dokdonensis]|uniref:Uncharacterized protein n=1 Tax=Polaribacter dokdonensis DSW-5 TaxID=1300348 RepID=A0A0N0UNH0_9FLAO|nr:hypothetical protein [Polaribacter dokdonensis]KOY51617.1 hypothetical protein I602_1177 [Polaribacter dokdonensis DSW-5]SEE07287.1 hypothetical protein SAMN05444353_0595 [Polaribacter dokdonensis DSW-5]
MKKNNIKLILKCISYISLIAFGILYLLDTFFDVQFSDNSSIRQAFVVVYLITSLYYYKMDLKDKNERIKELEHRLNNKK